MRDGEAGCAGGAGEIVVAPVDALPTPVSSGDPNRLGGVPVMPGWDGAVGESKLGGVPAMLGVVPTIGAAPVDGPPTLPMGLPGTGEMDGAAPIAGAGPAAGAPPAGAGA